MDNSDYTTTNNNSSSINSNTNAPITPDSFDFGQVLGEGAFGQVKLCKHKGTDIQYAAKILQKENLMKKNQVWTAIEF